MKRSMFARLGVALVLVLGISSAAIAQEEDKGTVRAIHLDKNEVILKGVVSDTTYDINKDASVFLDGRKSKLADLKAGDKAQMFFKKSGDRRVTEEVRCLRNYSEDTATVRSVAADRNQLIVKGVVKDSTYDLEKGATVYVNQKVGALADLREGDRVIITYQKSGDRLNASEVRLLRNK